MMTDGLTGTIGRRKIPMRIRESGLSAACRPAAKNRNVWPSAACGNPNVQRTNYQLGQALIALDRTDEAELFLGGSAQLQEYLYRAHVVYGAKPGEDVDELGAAANAAESLGLLLESHGWAHLALAIDSTMPEALRILRQALPTPEESPDRCHQKSNIALHVDYSNYPFPRPTDVETKDGVPSAAVTDSGAIRFEDQAEAAGIVFQYFNGGNPDEQHVVPLYEQTGGGIGSLDYDTDGWPDLYLTQGCAWPPSPRQDQHFDQLYRNTGAGMFTDATTHAGIAGNGFGQGVAAGDFDNDGFEDLFIANIGPNRLWKNNGDGTFTDITHDSRTDDNAWTTSCAICDLNGDRLRDIYAVNYLGGNDLFTRKCRFPDGSPRPCQIQSYEAAHDRLSLNLGDGRFKDVTVDAGIRSPEGRDLGIAAEKFDDSETIDLFIANDASPNFYFRNVSARGAATPKFEDLGLLAGLAAN